MVVAVDKMNGCRRTADTHTYMSYVHIYIYILYTTRSIYHVEVHKVEDGRYRRSRKRPCPPILGKCRKFSGGAR